MPKIFSEEDREIIRSKLIANGIELLKTKRYRSISLDEITEKTGIAKGTFYNFFSSKESFFYEIMQKIKLENRIELKCVFENENTGRQAAEDYLFRRYTKSISVYSLFTPEEITLISRKIPNAEDDNDSIYFAESVLENFPEARKKCDAGVIVNMFNIMGMASANRNMLEEKYYCETVRLLAKATADYIFGGDN